jgi:hypothetical protein
MLRSANSTPGRQRVNTLVLPTLEELIAQIWPHYLECVHTRVLKQPQPLKSALRIGCNGTPLLSSLSS